MKNLLTTFILIFLVSNIFGQQVYETRKYGITLSAPVFSFISPSDTDITGAGANLSYGVGVHMEFPMRSYLNFVSGVGFRGNVGGRLKHRDGGNLWPESILSNPAWNTGEKPLPDGTELRYKVNILEIPAGLKFYTPYNNGKQFFFEIPVLTLGFRINANGNIEAPMINARAENIKPEVRFLHLMAGGTIGLNYFVGKTQMEIGLSIHRWISDMTRNNGKRAIETTPGSFAVRDINSKDSPLLIGLRLGLFF